MKNYWMDKAKLKKDFYLSKVPREVGENLFEQIGIVEMTCENEAWIHFDWHGYGGWVSRDWIPGLKVGDFVYTRFQWGCFRPIIVEARDLSKEERVFV